MTAVVTLVISAVLLWIGQGLQVAIARRDRRATLKADLEMYKELPEDFASRADLAASIEARVRALSALPVAHTDVELRQESRRHARTEVVGVVLYATGTIGFAFATRTAAVLELHPNVIRVASLAFLIVGAVRFFQGVSRASRTRREQAERTLVRQTVDALETAINKKMAERPSAVERTSEGSTPSETDRAP
ncbi:hypothetical protein R4172_11020 [Rhodococcus kroppenstedtii]|uniref:hypothetical protein n=1 Tax=Rhodococcoides kroppenstedtii TaxID=293050 RepID=UPI002952C651|nr:hypothetical protein [Rhodococcus kroppenstedtii]MDV7198095.1 hypothetical protein [Rhodococcus kroppenstedtii]